MQDGIQHTALKDLKISLDAYTLDITAGKRRLESIDPNGSLIFEEPKDPEVKLTEDLERIWNEYPGGLLDVTEEKLEKLVPEVSAVPDVKSEVKESEVRDRSKMMSSEEMEGLRSDMFLQLNEARNELWFVLELAKTLSASSGFTINPPSTTQTPPKAKPPKAQNINTTTKSLASLQAGIEPPILPPGTFTSTPSLPLPRPTYAQALELELALQAKQRAVEECSEMIDAAVEELQTIAKAGERFWRDVKELKDGVGGRGRWAVVGRPDFWRSMKEGEGVRDVVIPYAIDEASVGMRTRSLAAFDLDPTKEDALTFGARNHQRLQITMSYHDGEIFASSRSKSKTDTIGARMEDAQLEAFDEELFSEIQGEVSRRGVGLIEPNRISIDAGDTEIMFSLYDTRTTGPASHVQKPYYCDMILHSARLSLLNLQRHRKRQVVSLNAPDPIEIPRVPSLVDPIVQTIQYLGNTVNIARSLALARDYLRAAGIKASVLEGRSEGDVYEKVKFEALLRGEKGPEVLGGVFTLEIPGSKGCSVDITAPNDIRVTASIASFPLIDVNELPHILANDVSLQLLSLVYGTITSSFPELVVFLDEVERTISLIDRGTIRVSIPPSYELVMAEYELSESTAEVRTFNGEGNMLDWARDAVSSIRDTSHNAVNE